MVGFTGLHAGLRLLQSAGAGPDSNRLAERIRSILDQAVAMLEEVGAEISRSPAPDHDSGILSFMLPGIDPHRIRSECRAANVVVSVRGGRLRISPHVYNHQDDLERLMNVLRKVRS